MVMSLLAPPATTGHQKKGKGKIKGGHQKRKGKGGCEQHGETTADPRAPTPQEQTHQKEVQVITVLVQKNSKTKIACSGILSSYEQFKRDVDADKLWAWVQKGNGALLEDSSHDFTTIISQSNRIVFIVTTEPLQPSCEQHEPTSE